MYIIHDRHRKPLIEKKFAKQCKKAIRQQLYYYKDKDISNMYISGLQTEVSEEVINNEMRGQYNQFLKDNGYPICDNSIYLLSLLQKAGEDKIRDSVGGDKKVIRTLSAMSVNTLTERTGDTSLRSYMFKSGLSEKLNLSVMVAQAIIFAFNVFPKIWEDLNANVGVAN